MAIAEAMANQPAEEQMAMMPTIMDLATTLTPIGNQYADLAALTDVQSLEPPNVGQMAINVALTNIANAIDEENQAIPDEDQPPTAPGFLSVRGPLGVPAEPINAPPQEPISGLVTPAPQTPAPSGPPPGTVSSGPAAPAPSQTAQPAPSDDFAGLPDEDESGAPQGSQTGISEPSGGGGGFLNERRALRTRRRRRTETRQAQLAEPPPVEEETPAPPGEGFAPEDSVIDLDIRRSPLAPRLGG